MPLTRRQLLTSALATGLIPGGPALALSGEPFPVSEKDVKAVPFKYQRHEVEYDTQEPAGTIVVDGKRCFLYHVTGERPGHALWRRGRQGGRFMEGRGGHQAHGEMAGVGADA